MKKMLLLISVVSLAVASAANSFRVDLYQASVVNGTTLKAGEAKVELQDNKVIVKQGKVSVEATVKVESNKDKYHYTTVGYKDGSDHQIKDICVGGTTTHIWFE